MPDFEAVVRTSGPVFNGRAIAVLRGPALNAARKAVATEGAQMVRQRLKVVIRHPTGHYMSSVRAQPVSDLWEVNDSGVVYGAWLEGTGSRNFPRTRFRGYATFRRTKALLDQRSGAIAQRAIAPYIRELNGR